MADRLLQTSFELFPGGGNRCGTTFIIRKAIPNLASIKSKTIAKPFD